MPGAYAWFEVWGSLFLMPARQHLLLFRFSRLPACLFSSLAYNLRSRTRGTGEKLRRPMRPYLPIAILTMSAFFLPVIAGDTPPLDGYSAAASQAERDWESKFRALPSAQNQRDYMQLLSARPHHVGSAYDKKNAEWILARFKEWGWDAQIEQFDVLFPTPKRRVVELVAPTRFAAGLQEPPVAADPTSNQQAEQLPTYNAYSADGDVSAPLVYVNYG